MIWLSFKKLKTWIRPFLTISWMQLMLKRTRHTLWSLASDLGSKRTMKVVRSSMRSTIAPHGLRLKNHGCTTIQNLMNSNVSPSSHRSIYCPRTERTSRILPLSRSIQNQPKPSTKLRLSTMLSRPTKQILQNRTSFCWEISMQIAAMLRRTI